MKRGKEIKLDVANNYSVVSGTVDNKNPKALYITISAWGEPTSDEDLNYKRVIRNMDKSVRQELFNTLDTEKFNRYGTIVDLDMRESGVAYNKRSFMSCEVTLFQKEEEPINTDKMCDTVSDISRDLIYNVFENVNHFKFHKRKK